MNRFIVIMNKKNFKMCKKYVPPNHPDICNIRNAYVAIKKTCKFIQVYFDYIKNFL